MKMMDLTYTKGEPAFPPPQEGGTVFAAAAHDLAQRTGARLEVRWQLVTQEPTEVLSADDSQRVQYVRVK